ncbi:MAG: hypothetical protein CMK09_09135 [Ponticaulis sp.]|nr:hypothetical protein [Ponticaulis sp.]
MILLGRVSRKLDRLAIIFILIARFGFAFAMDRAQGCSHSSTGSVGCSAQVTAQAQGKRGNERQARASPNTLIATEGALSRGGVM